MNKLILFLLPVCLILIPVTIFTSYYLLRADADHKEQSSSRTQPDSSLSTSSVTPTPNPKSGLPSERALAAAAYIVSQVPDSDLDQMSEMFGTRSRTEALKIIAIDFDNNPEKLAYAEVVIAREKANSGNVSGSASAQDFNTSQILDQSKQDCQRKWTEYNTCLAEYNAKQSEYQNCLSDPYRVYCSQPLSVNLCHKPFCFL